MTTNESAAMAVAVHVRMMNARRELAAASTARPMLGFAATRNPSQGNDVAASRPGDHCATPIAYHHEALKKTSAGHHDLRVMTKASKPLVRPTNSARAATMGIARNGIATRTAGNG